MATVRSNELEEKMMFQTNKQFFLFNFLTVILLITLSSIHADPERELDLSKIYKENIHWGKTIDWKNKVSFENDFEYLVINTKKRSFVFLRNSFDFIDYWPDTKLFILEERSYNTENPRTFTIIDEETSSIIGEGQRIVFSPSRKRFVFFQEGKDRREHSYVKIYSKNKLSGYSLIWVLSFRANKIDWKSENNIEIYTENFESKKYLLSEQKNGKWILSGVNLPDSEIIFSDKELQNCSNEEFKEKHSSQCQKYFEELLLKRYPKFYKRIGDRLILYSSNGTSRDFDDAYNHVGASNGESSREYVLEEYMTNINSSKIVFHGYESYSIFLFNHGDGSIADGGEFLISPTNDLVILSNGIDESATEWNYGFKLFETKKTTMNQVARIDDLEWALQDVQWINNRHFKLFHFYKEGEECILPRPFIDFYKVHNKWIASTDDRCFLIDVDLNHEVYY